MLNNTTVVRINITVPKRIIAELEKEVPDRGKSSFISTAIEEKLIRDRRKEALSNLLSLPSTFDAIGDSADYVTKMRSLDDVKRSKELTA